MHPILYVYILFSVSSTLIIKFSSIVENTKIAVDLFHVKINEYLILGVFIYGIGALLWLYILQSTKISMTIPFAFGTASTFILIGAVVFFGEAINLVNIIGIISIIFGVCALNYTVK